MRGLWKTAGAGEPFDASPLATRLGCSERKLNSVCNNVQRIPWKAASIDLERRMNEKADPDFPGSAAIDRPRAELCRPLPYLLATAPRKDRTTGLPRTRWLANRSSRS
jgi:hypothetical protein